MRGGHQMCIDVHTGILFFLQLKFSYLYHLNLTVCVFLERTVHKQMVVMNHETHYLISTGPMMSFKVLLF